MNLLIRLFIIFLLFLLSFEVYSTKISSFSPIYFSTAIYPNNQKITQDNRDLLVFYKSKSNLAGKNVVYIDQLLKIRRLGSVIKSDGDIVLLTNSDNKIDTIKNEFIIGYYLTMLPKLSWTISIFKYPIVIILMLIPSVLFIYHEINMINKYSMDLLVGITPKIRFKYYRYKYKLSSFLTNLKLKTYQLIRS